MEDRCPSDKQKPKKFNSSGLEKLELRKFNLSGLDKLELQIFNNTGLDKQQHKSFNDKTPETQKFNHSRLDTLELQKFNNSELKEPETQKCNTSGSDGNLSSLEFFDLKFSDLSDSDCYRFFRHGFIDEDDFEEFKQELRDFKRLQKEINEDLQLQSRARKQRHRRFHIGMCDQQQKQPLQHRRSARENSFIYDPPMELFSGNEHYEEFERVFDTISSRKRFSTDVDEFTRYRSRQRTPSVESDESNESRIKATSPFRFSYGSRHKLDFSDIDDSFMDFFNNDEDFVEFEKEFEKFKPSRRSHILDNLSSFDSCDIFEDVQMFCDRSLNNNNGDSEDSSHLADAESDFQMWNSAEEWDFVLNKLKRNSRMFSESDLVSPDCKNQHRKTHVDSSNICTCTHNDFPDCDTNDSEGKVSYGFSNKNFYN